MKTKLLDLSGKIDNFIVQVFETIVNVAESLNIPFFVVGATARDIILQYGYDIQLKRATQDIDFGVQISDWDHYTKLREALISTGKFRPDKKQSQRLVYEQRFLIDIVPFGAIADHGGFISWPPDHETKMNTLGIEEAYLHSITVRLSSNPILEVQFASLTGLALMKIISWHDGYPGRNRDAKDLALLLRTYLEAGNTERLFNEEKDLVEIEDFDYEHAGAKLLGRDIAKIVYPETAKILLAILDRETDEQNRFKLVVDMLENRGNFEGDFEQNLRLLKELKKGVLERL